jgi:hypothetical protein
MPVQTKHTALYVATEDNFYELYLKVSQGHIVLMYFNFFEQTDIHMIYV